MDPSRPSGPSDPFATFLQSRGLRLLEQVGETAEARLYRVETPVTAPPLLVAILNPSFNPEPPFPVPRRPPGLLEGLRRASRIQHPNVAGIREVSETPEGLVYAVLEVTTGELLADMVARRGPLPLQEAVDFCLQAAAGLHAAHGVGVVHGNLSPGTLVLAENPDGRPLLKVIAFPFDTLGAQAAEAPSGSVPDSGFSSPERLAGNAPNERDDVFSLGAVLHYMITGAPPTARRVRRSIPKRVRAVLRSALAPLPAERFKTVAEFADALQAATLAHNRAKDARVHRALILGVPAVSLILLVGLSREWVARSLTGLMARDYRESVPGPAAEHAVPAHSVPPVASGRGGRQLEAGRVKRVDTSAAGYAPLAEDTAPPALGPMVSPFRRSHPWAAVPGRRVYFRSSCSLALSAPDLVYFKSEEEATATGREKSAVPGCF
jgi:hypothetical protein